MHLLHDFLSGVLQVRIPDCRVNDVTRNGCEQRNTDCAPIEVDDANAHMPRLRDCINAGRDENA